MKTKLTTRTDLGVPAYNVTLVREHWECGPGQSKQTAIGHVQRQGSLPSMQTWLAFASSGIHNGATYLGSHRTRRAAVAAVTNHQEKQS